MANCNGCIGWLKTCTFSLWNICEYCLSTRLSNGKCGGFWILEIGRGTLLRLQEKAKESGRLKGTPSHSVIMIRFISEWGWNLFFYKIPSHIYLYFEVFFQKWKSIPTKFWWHTEGTTYQWAEIYVCLWRVWQTCKKQTIDAKKKKWNYSLAHHPHILLFLQTHYENTGTWGSIQVRKR